jgi:hypothetical protein
VALRLQEVAEAVTAERLRIARELHDMVVHRIGIIAIQAGVGSRVIQTRPAEARGSRRGAPASSPRQSGGVRVGTRRVRVAFLRCAVTAGVLQLRTWVVPWLPVWSASPE